MVALEMNFSLQLGPWEGVSPCFTGFQPGLQHGQNRPTGGRKGKRMSSVHKNRDSQKLAPVVVEHQGCGVFTWFSHGFHMVFTWLPHVLTPSKHIKTDILPMKNEVFTIYSDDIPGLEATRYFDQANKVGATRYETGNGSKPLS